MIRGLAMILFDPVGVVVFFFMFSVGYTHGYSCCCPPGSGGEKIVT
jgi:hypothetical protein